MHVVSIGYGRHLFTAENPERKRQELCAAAVESLSMVIFTNQSDGFTTTHGEQGLTLYPTNSVHIFQLYAAYRIASQIMKALPRGQVVVTTQDPFETGLVGWLLKLRFGVRLVTQEHADVYSTDNWRLESLGNRIRYRFGLWLLTRVDSIRVVSARSKESLIRKGFPAYTITQLPVALNLKKFQFAEPNSQIKSLFPENTFIFISVARFVQQKNLPLLLKAFSRVIRKNPNTGLLLVGTGPELSLIQNQIQLYGLDKIQAVQLLPWSADVPGLLKASDAYVLSSNYEGWARVLIEALGAGIPVVTTDVGCANEVIKDQEHGVVVPVGDSDALTAALLKLASDQEFYLQCTQAIAAIDTNTLPGAHLETYGAQWAATLTT